MQRHRGWTEASRLKERQQAGKSNPLPPRDTVEQTRRGPCEERHLPLSKHAPRVLKTRKERKHPPKWMPTAEFRCTHASSNDAAAVGDDESGGLPLPLAFYSPNVVQQVEDALQQEAEARRCRDGGGGGGGPTTTDDEPRLLRITDGGWAAELAPPGRRTVAAEGDYASSYHVPYRPPAEDYPDPEGVDVSWPLDRECAMWREKAAAQRQHARLPRGILSVVDDFLGGSVAPGFVLD